MRTLLIVAILLLPGQLIGEDGYRLWLRYDRIGDPAVVANYRRLMPGFQVDGQSPTDDVIRKELTLALTGMLGSGIPIKSNGTRLIVGTFGMGALKSLAAPTTVAGVSESYSISIQNVNGVRQLVIGANDDAGKLYGVFHLLRLMQMNSDLSQVQVIEHPKVKVRILNHWDNLDRTVERGYAGFSIWDWHRLPEYVDPRYTDYARANASIGINAAVLTNVNANARLITPDYLSKVKVIADVLRPYHIQVYLTARFSAPIEIGGLKTADPLDPEVQRWWNNKVDEIYQYVPDFGGFVVKANSEGQPGPQNYQRTHADGANMLADALVGHGGIVMWRAFVYDNNVPEDRAKQAFSEFTPLDGKFRNNVMVQVKSGPVDFQPREPFHPLFGAMPRTPLTMEFQITQEYLGQATHLVFLPTFFKEVLRADTYAKGKGSLVASVIDGSLDHHSLSAMAGVSNIGNDRNWTGHLFGQANWYGFGRLAWNHTTSDTAIAKEWVALTFGPSKSSPEIVDLMLQSHEKLVKYMTPLGLHHIMGANHHYGPGPWVNQMSRADWTSTYYHRADSLGIGFDRSTSGSHAVDQYKPEVARAWGDPNTCPENLLLWFHHVRWDRKMRSGRTLWEELCRQYQQGVDEAKAMQTRWQKLEGVVDGERHRHVTMLLERQVHEAELWRNSCILYFQTFSKKPIPSGVEVGSKPLKYYQALEYPYAPGIRPRW